MPKLGLNVLRHHMAYLRPEVVVFSFVSDAVSDEDETAMAEALLVETPAEDDVRQWVGMGTTLSDGVGGNS